MLSFDLRSLESTAVRVDDRLAADDDVWEDGDAKPVDAVAVAGRLSIAGSDRFYFSGHLNGVTATTCRLCLTDVTVPVAEDFHLIFTEAGAEDAEDPDVYLVDPRARDLDVRPAIREQWLLAVPAFAQCRDDCQGLCPTCGADRNAGPCGCEPATDSRWDALRMGRDDPT